ncbi:MAG: ribosome silencing factor [Elusimicrobiota bacterium]
MKDNKNEFKNIAITVARLADAKKAEAVAVYDMAGRSELADYVVVVTVDNPTQLDAVDDEISINLKKEGFYAIYRDGMKSKNWKVLDYGGIIVHIFEKQAREFYSFDKVYAGYSAIKWEEKVAAQTHGGKTARQQDSAAVKVARKSVQKKAPVAAKKAKAAPVKSKKIAAKKTPTKKTAAKKAVKKAPARKAASQKAAKKKVSKKKK